MLESIKIEKEEKNAVLSYVLFGVIALLITIFSDAYLFNPFIIVLLFFAYRYRNGTAVIANLVMIVTAFVININYGLELGIVCFLFLFLETLSKLLHTNSLFKKYLSFIFTNLFVFALYLISKPDFYQFINGFINLLYSYGVLISLVNFQKVIEDDYAVFDDRAKIVLIASFSLLFAGMQVLYLAFFNLVHLIAKRCSSFVISACSIIFGAFLLYLFKGYNLNYIIISSVALLISAFIKNKYSMYVYLGVFVLTNILFVTNFYQNGYFYQGILAFLINLAMPKTWIEELQTIFKRNEDLVVLKNVHFANATKSKVRSIVSYLDCVLDPSLDREPTSLDKAKHNLEVSLCSACPRFQECELEKTRESIIKDKTGQVNRKEIIDKCLYPYKLIKRSEMAHDFYMSDLSYRHQAEERKRLYQNEIENIYRPLKELNESGEFKSKFERLKQKFEELHMSVKFHAFEENDIVLEVQNDCNIDQIVKVCEVTLGKNLYIKQQDDFKKSTLLVLSSRSLIELDKGLCLSSDPKESGDQIDGFKKQGVEYIILSDGMGHDKNANTVSSYVIKSLKAYQELEKNEKKIISNLNTLIKSKSMHEMYATLDLLKIDTIKKRGRIFKSGSFPTYLYQTGKLRKLSQIFPPLGIVSELDILHEDFEVEDGDIIILMSDGFGVIDEDFLKDKLERFSNLSASKIADCLYDELASQKNLEDDKTLCVIKVVKAKYND